MPPASQGPATSVLWTAGRVTGFCLALAVPIRVPAATVSLREQAAEVYQRHARTLEEANTLALQGETGRANAMLRSIVRQSDNPATRFMVANLLYSFDPDVSYAWHRSAWEAFPEDPLTNLEWAMEQHRRGEFAGAVPCYRRCFAAGLGANYIALLADCLIRTGDLRGAVEAWDAAGHPTHHTSIDFAIYEIYGKRSPLQRRSDLLASIHDGASDRIAALIELDLNFDRDWWNSNVFSPGLASDLDLARAILGENSRDYACLAALAKLAQIQNAGPAQVAEVFRAAGFDFAQPSELPRSTLALRAMVEQMIQADVHKPALLYDALENELWARAKPEANDRDALHLLAFLAVRAENGRLEEIARYGWSVCHDPDFAASLAIELFARHPAEARGLVSDARRTHPEHAELAKLAYRLCDNPESDVDVIVDAIKAEYQDLSYGLAIRDSYTLKSLFFRLKSALANSSGAAR